MPEVLQPIWNVLQYPVMAGLAVTAIWLFRRSAQSRNRRYDDSE